MYNSFCEMNNYLDVLVSGLERLDLEPRALDAPVLDGVADDSVEGVVEAVTVSNDLVVVERSQYSAHCGCPGVFYVVLEVGNLVAGLVAVDDAEEEGA